MTLPELLWRPGQFFAAVFAVFDRQAEIERGLRIWKKTGTSIDADLRELWLHELRQVRRLMASAGASDVIVELIEPVEDDHEFAVVLTESGQPLSVLRSKVDFDALDAKLACSNISSAAVEQRWPVGQRPRFGSWPGPCSWNVIGRHRDDWWLPRAGLPLDRVRMEHVVRGTS